MNPTRPAQWPLRLISFVAVTCLAAFVVQWGDTRIVNKLAGLSAAGVLEYEKRIHSHSYLSLLVALLFLGAIYLGLIEGLRLLVAKIASPRADDRLSAP